MATMGSWRELLFLYLILLNIVTLTVSQPDFLKYYSISESGNYSTNSTYQRNLETLLSSLPSGTDRYGFYNASFGEDPDKVYAIVLCRGDVDLDTCRSCINDSTIKLPQLNPIYKGAIGWYGYCMLRYSNKSMTGIQATNPDYYRWNNKNATSVNEFNQALRSLLDGLRSQAASGGARRKFAANYTTGPDFQTIYGLMQCTPDLTQKDCNNCLGWAAGQIPQYFDGKKDNTTRTIIISAVLTIIPVIGLIVCICIFLRKRKQKKKPKHQVEARQRQVGPAASSRPGNTSGPAFQPIYGLIQCTPDLSETDCKNCLQGATENIPQYFGEKIRGRILTPSCNLRYENYSFITEIPAAAPPAITEIPAAAPPATPGIAYLS
ncbi:hypothetical protein RHGRI_021475 [Rhododendron griersonianum]|uniref:Gnk2-homologous domain-containing protein n=1 Tax=Rhododendron griersonianum TaxID=479676 RepID=A0AAV6JKM0_9ERIC|nr:hypothetical protein RHGRI_021475 [Rhododendron griersonianum]